LVVDDEEVVLASVRKALRKDDYEIDTVERADDGLALLEDRSYDVVLTDLMMPEVDGLELLTRIRDKKLAVQAIMITGYPTVKTALKAKKLGAFEYVTKPFTRQELRSVVVRALRHAAEQQASAEGSAPAPPTTNGADSGPSFYIPDHSYARRQPDGTVLVGMARGFAQSVGDVAEVRLPVPDSLVEQGRACLVVVAADGIEHSLHAPMSGRVLAPNEALAGDPAKAGLDPEGAGWLFRLEPHDPDRELQNLVPS
jgi:CheY-like chemotaxis protein/glycine cleavage system H lipoate-binding protein